MKRRWLLCLYPKAWRERYAMEYLVLLEEVPFSGRMVLDVVRGAVDAHLHPCRLHAFRRKRAGWFATCLLYVVLALPLRPIASDQSLRAAPAYQG